MKYLSNRGPQQPSAAGVHLYRTEAGEELWPALWEYLSVHSWEDGTAREASTLLLFVDDGRLKVMINDRDAGRVAFVTATSLLEALGDLEVGLASNSLDWRRSKPQAGGRRPGK